MTHEYTLPLADPRANLATVGGKGASLTRLINAGLPVPDGFHVTTAAYCQFVAKNDLQPGILAALQQVDAAQPGTLEDASRAIGELFAGAPMPPDIAAAVSQAYTDLPGDHPVVAVRSSATAEDLPGLSFAGQQETFLNIHGVEAVLNAVKRCWASLWTARAIGYRAQHGIEQEAVSLAVVVQTLVHAEAAGILFTANPVNGRRDQVVINAAWGLGESIVGGAVTPDTLTVDKASGRVLARETADKQVMTVLLESGTEEHPVPETMRCTPVLSDQQAAELVRLGVQIEELYGMPMDIEWAIAEGRFAIVQARPITALPEPEASAPIRWTLPDPKGKYMRVSITELMPDPLSPLFATLGMFAIDNAINSMSKDLLNLPEGTFSGFVLTINGYSYQKVAFTGRQWWLMLTRMGPAIPRLLREGVSYWQDLAHPRYVETTARWRAKSLPDLSSAELLAGINEVLDAFAQHLASLMTSTMGPSAGSEGLFTKVYEKTAMHPGDPAAPTFLMGFDSIPIKSEKALFDLASWCREREELAAYLIDAPTEQLVAQLDRDEPPASISADGWREWQSRFRDYLDRYGYSIYDMDFAKPLPMDDPAPMLETLKLFIADQGRSPYKRQQAYAERREQAVQSARARLKGFKRWAFEKALKWAQSQAPLREDGIAEIGLGYPVLRRMLRELGRRFVAANAIEQTDDIFWLVRDEVEQGAARLDRGDPLNDLTENVRQRKAEWRAAKRATPPPMLPPSKKFMGVSTEAWLTADEGSQTGDTIKGVATSAGRVTATARVLHGPEDFDQMQPGDILVASITTPAWTPLFAMASAIVTDVGGPLSHGSIVAREYGIPAVLGTGVATKRIRSGQMITVDGSAGVVLLKSN